MQHSVECMGMERHVEQVQALRRVRDSTGVEPIAQCQPTAALVATATPGRRQVTLHVVRHGEAEHNAQAAMPGAAACDCKRADPQGRDTPGSQCPYNSEAAFDAALTEEGRRQAAALLPHTRQNCPGIQLVVSSPLRRAVETALLAFDPPGGV